MATQGSMVLYVLNSGTQAGASRPAVVLEVVDTDTLELQVFLKADDFASPFDPTFTHVTADEGDSTQQGTWYEIPT